MKTTAKSRRDFLKSGSSALGASWLTLNMPLVLAACRKAEQDKQTGAVFENLSSQEGLEIGALADQIIPPDETPGAVDTGVVYFIDAALGGFMAGAAPMLRQGLQDLQARAEAAQPGVRHFSGLPFERQTDVLRSIEDTPFFGTVQFLTICGMLCLPKHGGNREHAGWALLGFDHRHAWQPPFGYYDAAVHNQQAEGESDIEQS